MEIAQKPRHSNDEGVYFHIGNTVVDLSKLDNDEFEEYLGNLEIYLDNLKSLRKQKNEKE